MTKLPGDCWVITDASAGNQRQALALAGCLQMPTRHLLLEPRAPWSWLAPRLTFAAGLALPTSQRGSFLPPWPQVAIGCGRAAALFTRMLRRLSAGRCHTVQILDPRIDPRHWDTVIAPRHDQLHGANVLTALGSLNPIDDEWLADGRESCPQFAELPQPLTGVLLGGSRGHVVLDSAYAHQLAARLLQRQHQEGGSVLAVASGRTSTELVETLRTALQQVPGLVWAGHDDGRNPYPGVLGWADRLLVTPDSVNMLSEACATCCLVETLVTAPLPPKLARFHRALRDTGRLQDADALSSSHLAVPLRETAAIAAVLRERILATQAPSRIQRS